MGRGSATSLAPGFRFHPTDEELVRYYLKRKVCGKPFRFDAICEIDVYKSEPWDLPDKSRLKSRDLEWYFFSVLDKKYGNGSRTNRATEKGYWKTTGKDRTVYHNSQVVGMKKTLVYHSGRAPRGERTNWVMHEYRLVDKQLEKAGIVQDAFVLCRIFQKSGSGPKNGERYGAPFIEEEWDDDEMVFIPGENAEEKLIVGDDEFVETCDLGQNLNTGLPSEDAPPPLYFYYEDGNKHAEDAIDDEHKPLIDTNENFSGSEIQGDPNYFEVPAEYEMQAKCGKNEFIIEQSNTANPLCPDSFLQEPYFDAIETPPSNDGFFLETNDLSDPIDPEPPTFDMLDEYLRYFDVADDNTEFFDFDSWKNGTEGSAPADPVSLFIKDEVGVSEKISRTSEEIMELHDVDGPSSSYQNPEVTEYASDVKYPFSKKAHCTLETFLAPPLAFASELPTKDAAALRFALSTQSSSSVHVTAGVIHIRNTGLKNGSIDVVLSFAHGVDSLGTSLASLVWSKSTSAMSGEEWLYFFFFTWILVIVCVSFKVGACVYSR